MIHSVSFKIMCKTYKCKFFDKKTLTNVKLSSKITIDNLGISVPLYAEIIKKYFFERRYAMNWDVFMEVWESFMTFMDRVVQWLTWLFDGRANGETWPPEEYPDIDD